MKRKADRAVPAGCPACSAPMRVLRLERTPHGHVEVDVCPQCRGLWFDAFESLQLTAEATLALLREVAAHAEASPRRADGPLPCPRCGLRLAPTQDVQRTTRFSYWRCPRGHGRFTPLLQFMREKDFVRPLTPQEMERLRAQLGTVRCSGCGAPVDLGRDPACRYCGARVEALDPDAVRKAIERGRRPAAPAPPEPPATLPARAVRPATGFDLVVDALQGLLAGLAR